MKDRRDSIRRYDDALLKRERQIRILRVVCVVAIGLVLTCALILAPSGFFQDRLSTLTVPLVCLLVACGSLDASLRHIASIKLYREEMEQPQPQN